MSHTVQPLRKKQRTVQNTSRRGDCPAACSFILIPFELIAEILSYTSSPKDVLALARCNKFFCATLVSNPSSVFIWREARARVKPEPIPDPLPHMTEPAYASLIFDKGRCDMCGKSCKEMYTSFALKIRVCSKVKCKRAFERSLFSSLSGDEGFHNWLPYLESEHCLDRHGVPHPVIGSMPAKHRISDRDAALDEYNKAKRSQLTFEEYTATKAKASRTFREYMLRCFQLYCWKVKWEAAQKRVRQSNDAIARRIAAKEGWNIWELLHVTRYRQLYNRSVSLLEEVSDSEFLENRRQIKFELTKAKERRANIAEEFANKKRRQEIEEYYDGLKAKANRFEALPVLSEFRKLPFVKTLQSKSIAIAKADLQSDLVTRMITDDLLKWREEMQDVFGAKLGYPKWKTPNSLKLHPVYRMNSLFVCQKCDTRKRRDQALTFEEACVHQCQGRKKKQQKQVWEAEQFVPHERARKAVQNFAQSAGIHLELETSYEVPVDDSVHVLCLSCSAAIVMNFRQMIRHSVRHEEMTVVTLAESQMAAIAEFPIEYGLTKKLQRGLRDEKDVGVWVYMCRHCNQIREQSDSIACTSDEAGISAGIYVGNKKGKHMNFNGLRSHLKEKHGVEWIDDEDYCRIKVSAENIPAHTLLL